MELARQVIGEHESAQGRFRKLIISESPAVRLP
jgi:hypothetical protein